jgi:uncharacterized membrane protein
MSQSSILNIGLIALIVLLGLIKIKVQKTIDQGLTITRESGMTLRQYMNYCLSVCIAVLCMILVMAIKAQGVFK